MLLTRKEAKDYIKQNYTEDYLNRRGTPTNHNFKCIVMGEGHKGGDKHPSMGYDAKAKQLHCFTCGERLDIFDLIGMDYGARDFNEQLSKACDIYGVSISKESTTEYSKPRTKAPEHKPEREEKPETRTDKYEEYYKRCNARLQEVYNDGYYLAQRGLSLDTLNHHNIGHDDSYQRKDGAKPVASVIMPNSNGYFTPRAINPEENPGGRKNMFRAGDKRGLFHAEALEDPDHPCIICEGEIDAMSVYEVGGNAVGLGGTSGVNLLLTALRSRKSTTPIVLALDNDEAGRKATDKAVEGIETLLEDKAVNQDNVSYVILNPYHGHKDANDMLCADRRQFSLDVSEIMKNPRKWAYLNTRCAASYMNEFRNEVGARANTPPISTGFYKLDEALGGGLYEGLYAIGAVSSLGKTTLCQQIGDNITMAGKDVVYISLEMSRLELMAKTVSRYTYINTLNGECGGDERNAKTTRGILDGSRYSRYSEEEKELIGLSVQDYAQIARHMFIEEGIGDISVKEIRDIVRNHIDITGNKPVLIVDYLQIIAPANARASDKQNMDRAIIELKRISRDFKIPVIVVSSLNRSNYATEDGISELAFKESGSIEYSVDVLIGLEFTGAKDMKAVREAKSKNPREVDLVIIKNRNAGIPKEPVQLNYNPLFNYFEEA